MSETNYEHLVSTGDAPEWQIRHDYAYGDAETCGEMDATIFVPCNGSKHTIVYEVATMRDVPLRWNDLDGENVIDRGDPRVKE